MKRMIGVWILMSCIHFKVWAQVDTSYIYNSSMPYGVLDLRLAKSETRYYYLQEDTTFSYRTNSEGVRSTTYHDMTAWDSSPYRQGNLRERNGSSSLFVMNYRILFPQGYDPQYDPGYPIIMMIHGAGEAGNCWGDNCYWASRSWDPNQNDPEAPPDLLPLLNNDRNLLHGGQLHLNAVKAAGTRKPDDPTLPATAFPGFVLFPQSLNGWLQPAKVEDAIRILRLIIKKYNIDENRVYIHGLSNGGAGVNQAVKRAPWLFACSATMSAISDGEIVLHNQLEEAKKLPMWIFQGGQDTNPTPSKTYSFVKKLRDAGAVIRYYLYPTLGHGTWNTAYREPDFFTWMLGKRKYNPHISYGNPVICNTTGSGVRMSFSKGFLAYQWEKDGVVISGENSAVYTANAPGTYRGRFSRRSANPAEDEWEPWSDPIVVTDINPPKPEVTVMGSTHLRGPGLAGTEQNNTVVLSSMNEAELYNWYKNGQLVNFPNTDIDDTLSVARFATGSSSANGAYTLVIKQSYCPSPPSEPVYLFFGNSAPVNMSLSAATANLRGTATSSTVYLTWNDPLNNETGYEIWRRRTGSPEFVFAGRTGKDAISFLDRGLQPSTVYEYKLRAISNSGRSNYIPSDNLNNNYQITTEADTRTPAAPQNVRVVANDINAITLAWQPASDETGIKEYVIRYGDQEVTVAATQDSYTINGLPPNTVYPITIRAIDHAGHVSQPSNQVTGTTYVLGLRYKHSTGAWIDLDDTTLTKTFESPEFTGTINNFSLTPRTQDDYFNFQFLGYLNIATDSLYVFRLTSDDGSRLILDDSVLVDNDGKHGTRTVTGDSVRLSAGLHAIEVQYFDHTGVHNLTVQYAGPGISDGQTFVPIPDAALKSGEYSPPTPPDPPFNVNATAISMQSVTVGWEYADSTEIEFEVYRSETAEGPFSIVARVPSTSCTDSVNLKPGTLYYYSVKAVRPYAASSLAPADTARTFDDTVSPTVPVNLQMLQKTYTSVALTWTPSSDNTGVSKYLIYGNGNLLGESDVNSFTAEDLSSILYSFTVSAVDASGNESSQSGALAVDNTVSGMFFSLPSGNLNDLSTWKKYEDGTGPSPSSFSTEGQTFVIRNRSVTGLGGDWATGAGSRVIVPEGVTLNLDHECVCTIELQDESVLNVNAASLPPLSAVSETSTINFNVFTTIPAGTYGNVNLFGSGEKIIGQDTVRIAGDLVIGEGVVLSGASTPIVDVDGDIILQGSSPVHHRVHIAFSQNTLHKIQLSSDAHFDQITARINANINVNSPSPVTIATGSADGGGINLANGALLNADQNNIRISARGTVNPGSARGAFAVNGADVTIESTAEAGSNLYFDSTANTVATLEVNTSAAVTIGSHVNIREGIKIVQGRLEAGGNVTLMANDGHEAIIYPLTAEGVITGKITAQKYLSQAGKVWRDLSSPVAGATVSQWQAHFPITGDFSGASAGDGLTNEASMFRSNGMKDGLEPYPAAGSSNTAVLEKGRGYAVFMHALNDSTPTIASVTGVPFQHNITFDLAGGTGSAEDGWTLVGNPFASPVVWNEGTSWVRSGIHRTIAVRESYFEEGKTCSRYRYFDPVIQPAVIPPGEAFWVHAIHPSPLLTITENAKSATAPPPSAILEQLILKISNGERFDEALIVFDTSATGSYDASLDAVKLRNDGVIEIATMTDDNVSLAINYLDKNTACDVVIPVRLGSVSEGSYSFEVQAPFGLTGVSSIVLEDRLTQSMHTFGGDNYTFVVHTEGLNSIADRFLLHLRKEVPDLASHTLSATNACPGTSAIVTVGNTIAGLQYRAINSVEESISDIVSGNGASIELVIDQSMLAEGANTVKVLAGNPGCTPTRIPGNIEINSTRTLEVNTEPVVTACSGTDVTLTATASENANTFQWFDSGKHPVEGATGAVFVIESVTASATYHVAARNPYGCESAMASVVLEVVTTSKPLITMRNDTLFTTAADSLQWFLDGEAIAGAYGPFLLPSDSGLYAVTTWNGNCSATSDSFAYDVTDDGDGGTGDSGDGGDGGDGGDSTVVSISPDPAASFGLEVFPVPSDGVFNFVLTSPTRQPFELRLITPTGVERFSGTFTAQAVGKTMQLTTQIPLSGGIYIIIARQGMNEIRKKVIVRNAGR